MPVAWIEAWKAWLSRVAERFVRTGGPHVEADAQRVPAPRSHHADSHAPNKPKAAPHRSGRRHG